MQVLIVNCFDWDSDLGVKSYNIFRKSIISSFSQGVKSYSDKSDIKKLRNNGGNSSNNIEVTLKNNKSSNEIYSNNSSDDEISHKKSKDKNLADREECDNYSDDDIGDIENDNNFIERRMDEISDLVVDWEYENINNEAKTVIKDFDKIDFIFIGGDMKKVLPWDPIASKLVTLINMANVTNKPLFGVGFGAFITVYSIATRGARYHMLNGPLGNSNPYELLPKYERYSVGTDAYPSGWMDNETGDIYSFHTNTKSWKSKCNIGINRQPSYGNPTPTNHTFIDRIRNNNSNNPFSPIQTPPTGSSRPVTKRQFLDSRGHSRELTRSQIPIEKMNPQEDIAYVRSSFIQHPFILNINKYSENTANNKFLTKLYPDWYINYEGALPKGLCVLADGDKGPLLITKDNRILLLPIEINNSKRYFGPTKVITNNFTKCMLERIKSGKYKQMSLLKLLFGEDGLGIGELYDSIKHKKNMTPPLNRCDIPSILRQGPIKVDLPNINIFFSRPLSHKVDNFALTGNRMSSSLGRKPKITIQDPCAASVKEKRLINIFEKVGVKGDPIFMHDYLTHSELSNKETLRNDIPEDLQDLFAGRQRKMNYNNNKSFEDCTEVEVRTVESTLGFESIIINNNNDNKRNYNNNNKVPQISDWDRVSNHTPFEEYPPKKIEKTHSARTYGGTEYNTKLNSNNNNNNNNINVSQTARNFKTTALCGTIADTHYLPVKHPKALSKNNDFLNTDNKRVVNIPFTKSGPYNTYKTITTNIEKEKEKEKNSKFVGTYTIPHVCEDERNIKEYNISKKKFVGGPFIATFGKASQIPLRKEGNIRGQGPYPEPVVGLHGVIASEWILAREYNKEKHIAGAWKA